MENVIETRRDIPSILVSIILALFKCIVYPGIADVPPSSYPHSSITDVDVSYKYSEEHTVLGEEQVLF